MMITDQSRFVEKLGSKITNNKVTNVIKLLKNRKSTGPDNMFVDILRVILEK